MAMATPGSEQIPSIVMPTDDSGEDLTATVKRRQKPGRKLNGVVKGDSRSMYISPTGLSTLDIRTRLRISEAELAIVQREVADLLAEKDTLETNARIFEESWKFAIQECGRIVEQRDDLERKLLSLENAVSAAYHPENHKDSKKKKVTKADLDQCKVALETQTRVAETLEHERDQAYDDYQFAQAQLHTLMHQYQQLSSTCSEVAREREKAKAEVALLREELHRYEPEPETQGVSMSRSSSRKISEHDTPAEEVPDSPSSALSLEDQVRELREERENLRAMYDMVLKQSEQYQKQVHRADEERRRALATSEALTALWQKKFEKAQVEQYELEQDLLSAQNRITLLSQQLAMTRLQGVGGPRHSPSEGDIARKLVRAPHSPSPSHRIDFFPPHRTASFHGSLNYSTAAPHTHSSSGSSSLSKKPSRSIGSINKLSLRDRHSGGKTTRELIGPLNDHSFVSRSQKRNHGVVTPDYGAGTGSSQSTEDEASWI